MAQPPRPAHGEIGSHDTAARSDCCEASTVRSFHRVNPGCSRRTVRPANVQRQVGLALCGAAGDRLSGRLTMPPSRDLVLRLFHCVKAPLSPNAARAGCRWPALATQTLVWVSLFPRMRSMARERNARPYQQWHPASARERLDRTGCVRRQPTGYACSRRT